jgi:propanol-preferring alcohol dehydrogenase
VIVSENLPKAMSQPAEGKLAYRAMVLEQPGQPLQLQHWPLRAPGTNEVRIRVLACAVCRTDLHVVDGELPQPKLPLVPGHEIIGVVDAVGSLETQTAEPPYSGTLAATGSAEWKVGQLVGVPWLGWTCGQCDYCRNGRENLCELAQFTGYTRDGGYAEYVYADPRYIFAVPESYTPAEAAPLMCAGLIGYRSYRFAGEARRLGIYGFGAAAHLLVQLARYEGRQVFAFTRPGDRAGQEFALRLGAVWAGDSDKLPPEPLDAAIIFAPVGALVPQALQAVRKGGVVVCGGIHMSDIPSFPYRLLWGERMVRSVANLTRRDAQEFLTLAPQVPVRTHVRTYPLEQANEALADLRAGRLTGAAVLIP